MECMVLVVSDDMLDDRLESNLAEEGFRRKLNTLDKKLAFQLPFPTFAAMREGDSAIQIRDEVLTQLAKHDISAFVLVAEGFTCGRT
jgi:hypothetical protein